MTATALDEGVDRKPTHVTALQSPELAAGRIVDLEERVKERYRQWGIYKPGDGFALSYDRMSFTVEDFKLGTINPQELLPISMDQVENINNTDVPQDFTFRSSKTVDRTLSASITAGFRAKTSFSAKVSIKSILEIGGSKEFEFSVSSTIGSSIRVAQTESWDWTVKTPPRSRVVATALLSNFEVNPSFESKIRIHVERHPNFDPGYHPVYVGITRDGRTEWWRASLYNSLYPMTDGFTAGPDQNTVYYTCRGNLAGTRGRKVYIRLDQYPNEQQGGAPTSTQILEVGNSEQVIASFMAPDLEESKVVLQALNK